ncbi:MAG: alpha/beta hydrolase [Acidobacteriota bacterium]
MRKRRLVRALKWAFLAAIVVLLAFVFLVAPYALAHLITSAGTRPMDLRLTSTPADFDLEFEEVSFSSRDGVGLQGWYMGGGHRGISVACGHGLFRSRREVLDRAAFLRKAGFNVLAFDFRRHGKSGGERVTLGYKERLDVEGAVDLLKARSPEDAIALYGVSMGAAAALLAAAEMPGVRSVVADSCFLSLEHTVSHHLKLIFGLPSFPLADEIQFFIERRGGFRGEEFDLERAVRLIGKRPLLFVAGSRDKRMPVELQRRLYRVASDPKSRFVVIEGATHGAAYRTDPEHYQRALLDFLVHGE